MLNPDGSIDAVIGFSVNGRPTSVFANGITIDAGAIGSALGAQIGRALAGDNVATQIGASTLLSTLLGNVGTALRGAAGFDPITTPVAFSESSLTGQLNATFGQLGVNLSGQATGALSSFIVGEIADALHLQGPGRGLFTVAGNTVSNQLLSNIANGADLFAGFNMGAMSAQLGNALGGFVGSLVGQAVVAPHNAQAALFASAAATIGSFALGGIPIIGPFVGSALGTIVGTWIGNSTGDQDKVATADVMLGGGGQLFWGNYFSNDGGNRYFADAMARHVVEDVNAVVSSLGASIDPATPLWPVKVGYFTGEFNQRFVFGDVNHGTPLTVDNTASAIAEADAAILQRITLSGGNPLLVRAFYASRDKGLAQLGLDLKVAQDYLRYLHDAPVLNALMAADPQSEFTAGWVATLLRAQELGLNQPVATSRAEGGNTVTDTFVNEQLVQHTVSDTDGNEAIREYTISYVHGRQDLRIDTYDDNSTLTFNWDQNGTEPWETVATTRDAQGALARVVTTADGGIVQVDTYAGGAVAARLFAGTAGDDQLGVVVGSGISGPTTLQGAAGNDTYYVGNPADVVIENPGEGTDTIIAGVSYALPANVENLTGTAGGGQSLSGNELGNVIRGGAGNDVLSGGGGADTLFGGDGIDLAAFHGSRFAYTLTGLAGGGLQVSGPDGVDTLWSVERLSFDGQEMPSRPPGGAPVVAHHGDFEGDGDDDLLWRHDGGSTAEWQMQGGIAVVERGLGAYNSDWRVAGVGDFNADGTDDVLWRHANGYVGAWQMHGGIVAIERGLGGFDNSWTIAGVGDFNGDGADDVLWRNANGAVGSWQMQGGVVAIERGLGSFDNSWTIVGLGDFNGDGTDDVLWRNASGGVVEWQMQGGVVAIERGLGGFDAGWGIAAIGDFEGDGDDDLLWRDIGGSVAEWQMQGGQVAVERGLGYFDADWAVAGIGDFDGYGADDVLWRHANGSVVEWQMQGGHIAVERGLGGFDPSWSIVETGDSNHDGTADIIWRHVGGSVAEWQMQAGQVAVERGLGYFDPAWHVV